MDHDPWLIKEVQRLTSELHQLKQDLALMAREFRLGMNAGDSTITISKQEWQAFAKRVEDSRIEIIGQLNDFMDNEHHRQLHWSALRLLTASGVLATELSSFQEKVKFIAKHTSEDNNDAQRLVEWFSAQLLPITDRISSRLLQMISRVLDPCEWSIEGTIAASGAEHGGAVRLRMAFAPQSAEERSREQREKEKRLARIRV